jgi:hypothetical protein
MYNSYIYIYIYIYSPISTIQHTNNILDKQQVLVHNKFITEHHIENNAYINIQNYLGLHRGCENPFHLIDHHKMSLCERLTGWNI